MHAHTNTCKERSSTSHNYTHHPTSSLANYLRRNVTTTHGTPGLQVEQIYNNDYTNTTSIPVCASPIYVTHVCSQDKHARCRNELFPAYKTLNNAHRKLFDTIMDCRCPLNAHARTSHARTTTTQTVDVTE